MKAEISKTVTLHPASAADLESLIQIRIEAMQESLERIGRFDSGRVRERLSKNFKPEYTWHILHENTPVGFMVLLPEKDGFHLEHLYILPKQQGQKIGETILKQIFKQADATRSRIRVGALRGSDSNRFYKRNGFVLVEETEFDNYYEREPV